MSTQWIDIMDAESVPRADVVAVNIHGKEIAVYEVDGEVFATDNKCTHGEGRLSDGFLLGNEIECPLHQGRFDVCTGKAMCSPLTQDLRVYPVRIENSRVLVQMSQ